MSRPTPKRAFGLREIEEIAGRPIDTANAKSALAGLEAYGYGKLGLNKLHRLAQYMAQVMHESARFRYDREIWGPTPAQKRYDTRTDLGNTAAIDGDGFAYAGRAGIQITGKANYAAFTRWAQERFPSAPDFVKNPDAVNTDPWEGLAGLWYWERNNINAYADSGDINRVTKIINGGQNGLSDRRALFVRAALVLLGYSPIEVLRFQMDAGLQADGVAGPLTLAALHRALVLALPLDTPDAPRITITPPGLRVAREYGIIATIGAALSALLIKLFGG